MSSSSYDSDDSAAYNKYYKSKRRSPSTRSPSPKDKKLKQLHGKRSMSYLPKLNYLKEYPFRGRTPSKRLQRTGILRLPGRKENTIWRKPKENEHNDQKGEFIKSYRRRTDRERICTLGAAEVFGKSASPQEFESEESESDSEEEVSGSEGTSSSEEERRKEKKKKKSKKRKKHKKHSKKSKKAKYQSKKSIKKKKRKCETESSDSEEEEEAQWVESGSKNRNPRDPMSTTAATEIREMGYSIDRTREAILAVRQQTGLSVVTTKQVLTWLLDDEDRRTSGNTESLKAENEKFREMQTCKVCMERPVKMTLVPCGHLVCCESCASNLQLCPICRQRIKSTVKTFMS